MDCCICSPMASIYRPPRNTICQSCYEGARCMIAFLKESDGEDRESNTCPNTHGSRLNPSKGISDAFKRMKDIKETEERMKDRLAFVDDLVSALKDGIHTDILVQPGNGPPIPAHRGLLATRSEILKTMLSSDECKAPAEDTICPPELSHEELQCLLEFLYCGTLRNIQRAETHACSLLLAADKYNIPLLKKLCEDLILRSLGPCNSLEVLEVADTCSNTRLKAHAMDNIVKHMEDVVLSAAYDSFALKNGHLSVEITRALLIEMKKAKTETAEPRVDLRVVMTTNNTLSQPENDQVWIKNCGLFWTTFYIIVLFWKAVLYKYSVYFHSAKFKASIMQNTR